MDSHESVGYAGDKRAIMARLHRIEGQVRGLERLVQQDTYCIDVLTQVAATTKALQGVALELLGDHLTHCVVDAVAAGGDEAAQKITEAREAIARLLRS